MQCINTNANRRDILGQELQNNMSEGIYFYNIELNPGAERWPK